MGQTRREFLAAAATGVTALTVPGRAWPHAAAATPTAFHTFVSDPSLKPPTLAVTARTTPSPGYVFVSTLTGPGQRGPMIVDDRGDVVWFRRTKAVAIDFRRQLYRGRPVLTWWEGTISQQGVGQGEGVIVDQSYKEVARVRAGNGLQADVHEFLLTPAGTALITAYDPVDADLTAVGGPASHPTLDSVVQEVDVRSGRTLFQWRSLDHVPITDSYAPILDPYDYFHVNSVDVDTDGNLLVCARNTSAVYKIDRRSGEVLWRLGGRSSDFQLGPRVFFMYQHDARAHADGTITLFDDGPGPSSTQSRAIRIGLDQAARHATLIQEFVHPTPISSVAMGNAQVLPGDSVFVGWGTEPYVTEFGPLGDVRFDATFPGGAWNYRAFRNVWVGKPAHGPAVAVRRHGAGATVYASWNGGTAHAFWRVEGGRDAQTLEPLRTVPRTGFETAIPVPGRPPVLRVSALDAGRRVLTSRVHRA